MQDMQGVMETVEKMNLSHLKLHDEEPICPECGSICTLHSREGLWKCCSYSITIKSWDVIRLHASVVKSLLQGAGIEQIVYKRVALDLDSAVSLSHLLPLFVLQAQDVGEGVGIRPLLSLREISDEASHENTLLPVIIELLSTGCSPDESLSLLTAATRNTIDSFRSDDPIGSALDANYLLENGSEVAAA